MAKKAAAKGTKSPGRPTGARTEKVITEANPSQCPKCGSTDREPYSNVRVMEFAGVDPRNGQAYTHVVWRRTRCRACGQSRIDRAQENRRPDGE